MYSEQIVLGSGVEAPCCLDACMQRHDYGRFGFGLPRLGIMAANFKGSVHDFCKEHVVQPCSVPWTSFYLSDFA